MSTTKINILILNPNSSRDMTEGVRKAVDSVVSDPTVHGNIPTLLICKFTTRLFLSPTYLSTYHPNQAIPSTQQAQSQGFTNCAFHYQTGPATSPASINDADDLASSTDAVLPALGDISSLDYDGVLVACYSVHPLVVRLQGQHDKAVLGIFEASVLSALSLLEPYAETTFGIVTTGTFWEQHLTNGVRDFLGLGGGQQQTNRFAGVYTTGLNAGDFHGGVPQEVVDAKLKDATRKLLKSSKVRVVVMGCAGMAGLEAIIRSVVTEEYGDKEKVFVIDGVKAGAGLLLETVRSARLFA